MLYYYKTDVSGGIDINKTKNYIMQNLPLLLIFYNKF